MWGGFHKLRTSDQFKKEWENFLETTGQVALPTFYQYVSSVVFKELVKQQYQISGSATETQQDISPITLECSALCSRSCLSKSAGKTQGIFY